MIPVKGVRSGYGIHGTGIPLVLVQDHVYPDRFGYWACGPDPVILTLGDQSLFVGIHITEFRHVVYS